MRGGSKGLPGESRKRSEARESKRGTDLSHRSGTNRRVRDELGVHLYDFLLPLTLVEGCSGDSRVGLHSGGQKGQEIESAC